MPIRAITFDFWSTLFSYTDEGGARQLVRIKALAHATRRSYRAAADAIEAAQAAQVLHHLDELRTMDALDAVRAALEYLSVDVSEECERELARVFARAILRYPVRPIEGALDAVAAARRRCRVGLISDTGLSPGRYLRRILREHGFLDYLQAAVFSDEAGAAKPSPRVFEQAARKLRVRPSEMLHIGDLESSDIEGAHGVGAQAALFAAENAMYAGSTTAEYTFHSWDAFIRALPEIVDGESPAGGGSARNQ